MFCTKCKNELKIINFQDTNIDICPSCHGVWLDKGELQKLIETDRYKLKLSPISEISESKGEKPWESEIGCPKCVEFGDGSLYCILHD